MIKKIGCAIALVLSALLFGCGGGGGGSSSPPLASKCDASPSECQPPVIVNPPKDANVVSGQPLILSVTTTATTSPTYQWQISIDGGATFSNISGATSTSYSLPSIANEDSETQFRVVASNGFGSTTSTPTTVTVSNGLKADTTTPLAIAAKLGKKVVLTAPIQLGGAGQLQWFRSGIAIPGATSTTLAIGPVTFGDDGASYSVQATSQTGLVNVSSAVINVVATAAAIPVSNCQAITQSGRYVLQKDLQAATRTEACLYVHDTKDVQIDCAGHEVSQGLPENAIALEIGKVQNFSITNCNLKGLQIYIADSDNGSITKNTLRLPPGTGWGGGGATAGVNFAYFDVWKSNRLLFDHNSVRGCYQQRISDSNTISNNTMTSPTEKTIYCPALILSDQSKHSRIFGNSLDGSSAGEFVLWEGVDDGVVIGDGDDEWVTDNVMKNFFDCGIEFTGKILNSVIRNNQIKNTGYCGIGGWYWFGMRGSVISDNAVDGAPALFKFFRIFGLRAAASDQYKNIAADETVWFQDNTFIGNRFVNPKGDSAEGSSIQLSANMNYMGSLSSMPGERMPGPGDYKLGNNVFKNNDFGHQLFGPNFGDSPLAPGQVIDGGGNICRKWLPESYPLNCN